MYELTSVMRLDQTIIQSCQRFIKLCGLQSMANAAVVIWSESPGRDVERETNELKQAEPFRQLFEKGARMVRFDGSQGSATAILQPLVRKNPIMLACQHETLRVDVTYTRGSSEPPSPGTNCCCSWWPWCRR